MLRLRASAVSGTRATDSVGCFQTSAAYQNPSHAAVMSVCGSCLNLSRQRFLNLLNRREGVRKNAAQRTALTTTILADIEKVYDLPKGCVRFYKPDGKTVYNRATKVKRIIDDYNKN